MGNWSTSEPCSCFYSSCPNHHYLTQPMHLILDTLFLSAAHEQITYYQPALVNFCTQPCIIWFHWGESEIKTGMIFSYRSSKKELGEKEIKYNALKYLFNISVDWLTLQKCFTISTTKKPKPARDEIVLEAESSLRLLSQGRLQNIQRKGYVRFVLWADIPPWLILIVILKTIPLPLSLHWIWYSQEGSSE